MNAFLKLTPRTLISTIATPVTPVLPPPSPFLDWGVVVASGIVIGKQLWSWFRESDTQDRHERNLYQQAILSRNEELTKHLIEMNHLLIGERTGKSR